MAGFGVSDVELLDSAIIVFVRHTLLIVMSIALTKLRNP